MVEELRFMNKERVAGHTITLGTPGNPSIVIFPSLAIARRRMQPSNQSN